jgi:hypothetical protein
MADLVAKDGLRCGKLVRRVDHDDGAGTFPAHRAALLIHASLSLAHLRFAGGNGLLLRQVEDA